jgi:hypothetical protein
MELSQHMSGSSGECSVACPHCEAVLEHPLPSTDATRHVSELAQSEERPVSPTYGSFKAEPEDALIQRNDELDLAFSENDDIVALGLFRNEACLVDGDLSKRNETVPAVQGVRDSASLPPSSFADVEATVQAKVTDIHAHASSIVTGVHNVPRCLRQPTRLLSSLPPGHMRRLATHGQEIRGPGPAPGVIPKPRRKPGFFFGTAGRARPLRTLLPTEDSATLRQGIARMGRIRKCTENGVIMKWVASDT